MKGRTVTALGLVALVAAGATHAKQPVKRAVNCAQSPYRNVIHGALNANLEISAYPTVCAVMGTVKGNVTVRSEASRCTKGAQYVALALKGGRIEGNVNAAGKRCVMVWLFDGAAVHGNIVYKAAGNVGFLGDGRGARVRGNVFLEKGHLWATGTSTTNRVDGNLVCGGGRPAGFARLATRTNWDGAGRDEKGQNG